MPILAVPWTEAEHTRAHVIPACKPNDYFESRLLVFPCYISTIHLHILRLHQSFRTLPVVFFFEKRILSSERIGHCAQPSQRSISK